MHDDLRARADARLDAALRERDVADPREAYRGRLRALREVDLALFERARQHYEEVVLPGLAAEGDPLEQWIEYGRFLAEMLAPGRIVSVDRTGRATPYKPPPAGDTAVFHLPSDGGQPAFALATPRAPTPAQRATYDLLVLRKEEL